MAGPDNMKLYTFLIGLALLGCKQNIDNKADSTPIREHSIQSVLWQQKSSEYILTSTKKQQ